MEKVQFLDTIEKIEDLAKSLRMLAISERRQMLEVQTRHLTQALKRSA